MERHVAMRAYELMITSRSIDDKCKELIEQGITVPNYHSGTGQEALSVGMALPAEARDYLMYTYRDFGALLAKGVFLDELAADLLLKVSGTTQGYGGIMHVVAPERGIVGRNSVFGSRFGIAIGLAQVAKQRKDGRVVICSFGEAEASRGALYEALNMACLHNLPVLFIAQNNGYAIGARTEDMFATRDMSGMWRGAPLPVMKVDGNDLTAMYEAVAAGMHHCRAGIGPVFIEGVTYRIDPHIPVDDASYRTQAEVEQWRVRDPIPRFKDKLIAQGVARAEELERLEADSAAAVERAFEAALKAEEPSPESAFDFIYHRREGRFHA